MGRTYRIGVLALQGAFIEHIHHTRRVHPQGGTKLDVFAVRTTEELESCDALIIPGGESTVMLNQAARQGMLPSLQAFVSDPARPVWGSCAGMILMSGREGISGGKRKQEGLDGVPGMRVVRNLYGAQIESFETPLDIPCLSSPSTPFPCVFIRAPAVHSLLPPPKSSPSPPVHPLALLPPELAPSPPADGITPSEWGTADPEALRTVMLRQGRKLVTSFHPELTADERIHQYFVEECCLGGRADI